MEWLTRLELATSCLEGRDSTIELQPRSGGQLTSLIVEISLPPHGVDTPTVPGAPLHLTAALGELPALTHLSTIRVMVYGPYTGRPSTGSFCFEN